MYKCKVNIKGESYLTDGKTKIYNAPPPATGLYGPWGPGVHEEDPFSQCPICEDTWFSDYDEYWREHWSAHADSRRHEFTIKEHIGSFLLNTKINFFVFKNTPYTFMKHIKQYSNRVVFNIKVYLFRIKHRARYKLQQFGKWIDTSLNNWNKYITKTCTNIEKELTV